MLLPLFFSLPSTVHFSHTFYISYLCFLFLLTYCVFVFKRGKSYGVARAYICFDPSFFPTLELAVCRFACFFPCSNEKKEDGRVSHEVH